MNKKFDDLLENTVTRFLCAVVGFSLAFLILDFIFSATAFQRWLLCM